MTPNDSISTSSSHTQYVNTVRKNRPLPKIPNKGTPKELNNNMTESSNDSSKSQNKLTAQQLFEMLSHNHEVEEDQFYASEYEEESPNYMLEPVDNRASGHFSFDASMNTPSLTSGRTSPCSNNSHHSIDSGNQKENRPNTEYAHYYQQGYKHCLTPTIQSQDISLVSDVKRLAELNQALMTPIIANKDIKFFQSTIDQQEVENSTTPDDYSNINTSSPLAMTSFSLTHDKESIKTYRRMATKTNDKNIQFTYAKYLLQLVSFYGVESEKNTTRDRLQEEAEYWIEKLAKSNHTEALYIKGQWHGHCGDKKAIGVFVGSQYKKVNQAKAFKCFQQAAKFGSTEAHYELAEYWKYRKDYKKALSNYRYAASKNHILSLYKLANIMLRGLLNQEKDVRQGLIFLKKAADTDKPESARSAYDLACLYSNDLESIGLDRNTLIAPSVSSQTYNLAVHYYRKADKLGLVLATFRLGYIYEHGHLNTEANVSEAFTYYLKAAEKKHEGAMLEISRLYKEGIPGFLNPNPIIAHEWCVRATESGNEIAEFMLGIYFEFGVGVNPDQKQAFVWYSKAASKGYGPAENKLNVPQSKRKSLALNQDVESKLDHRQNGSKGKKYYEDSVRIAEKSRRAHAEQENCQIM
ncbi:uncharacterized protein EV154DRAFT_456630 [Mucor mucedo]|uniref:uncharacterized protein n=1 Tax=Mucor mucedo TaxID=29922 RepID=UPI002221215A|nr:uncharacterized protein EV154DRAFT_456630 [Mucor mucedo]KAI7896342.1 hypothetical protein EV154DRAFT_456630 [Mucor mucedo]